MLLLLCWDQVGSEERLISTEACEGFGAKCKLMTLAADLLRGVLLKPLHCFDEVDFLHLRREDFPLGIKDCDAAPGGSEKLYCSVLDPRDSMKKATVRVLSSTQQGGGETEVVSHVAPTWR